MGAGRGARLRRDPAPNPNHNVMCSTYPESGDGNIAAAFGVLAAVYISSAAPGSTCPCAVFETSTDAGAHWTRHVVFDRCATGDGCSLPLTLSQGPLTRCSSARGRGSGGLAGLPASKNVPQEVEVVTTNNSGSSWSTPTTWETIGPAYHQSTLDRLRPYGGSGRAVAQCLPAVQSDVVLDARLPRTCSPRVSRNNGKTFSAPVQAELRAVTPTGSQATAEDDVSWVVVTPQYVYGAWGDWRATSGTRSRKHHRRRRVNSTPGSPGFRSAISRGARSREHSQTLASGEYRAEARAAAGSSSLMIVCVF